MKIRPVESPLVPGGRTERQASRYARGQAGRRAGGQAGRRAGGQEGKRAGGQEGRRAGGTRLMVVFAIFQTHLKIDSQEL
jgi:hypothetical protein